ncbi:hypothetical protein FUAX_18890 [Fulvitalea axinellae]|uniref:Uncharacterized protein n=1 Tax=Fulvitalea axinellae TaxID=1182444 RepID=A0AAU9CVJ6_9BACT|nr:hypothetical protein FUAX_18890 [Fulvitalea axinellae]
MKRSILKFGLIGLTLVACAKNESVEEDINSAENSKKHLVTFNNQIKSQIDISTGPMMRAATQDQSPKLGGKRLIVYKKIEEGKYTFFQELIAYRHKSDHPANIDEPFSLMLENGDYMVNSLNHKLRTNPWSGKVVEDSYRSYAWMILKCNFPVFMGSTVVPSGETCWNSDVFAGQKEFTIDGSATEIDIVSTRKVGLVKISSTTDLPENWSYVEVNVNTNVVSHITSGKTGSKRKHFYDIFKDKNPDMPQKGFEWEFYNLADDDVEVEILAKNERGELLTRKVIQHVPVEVGKVTTLKGDCFPIGQTSLSIKIEDTPYENGKTVTF